jgi:hypothetical protein
MPLKAIPLEYLCPTWVTMPNEFVNSAISPMKPWTP